MRRVHLWLAALGTLSLLLSGCVTEPATGKGVEKKTAALSRPGPFADVQAYDCGEGAKFAMAFQGRQAWLMLPDRYVALDAVEAASGAKFMGSGVMFWGQGDNAVLVLPTEHYDGCKIDPDAVLWAKARVQGVNFRAVGNEPGWYLEIQDGKQIVLVTNYGSVWQEFGAPAPQQDPKTGASVYMARNEGHNIRIEIKRDICKDSMSGEVFDDSVHVQLDDQQYLGCGRRLPR